MHLTHADYIKLVKEAYRKKRAGNELSNLLAQPTRSNIRRACLHLYQEYYDNKEDKILLRDEHALTDFFGPAEHGKQFLQLINNSVAEQFRTLNNYLKDETESTESKNVELLAWLIDFPHRPFVIGMNVILSDEEMVLINKSGDATSVEPEPSGNTAPQEKEAAVNLSGKLIEEAQGKNEYGALSNTEVRNGTRKGKAKRKIIIAAALLICSCFGYLVWQKISNANTVCVYWAEDHYEQIPCNQDAGGHTIVRMDSGKVKRFRMITKPDTITEWSVGKIYYIKDNNKIKYYTEGGCYPEDVKRKLKILSRFMFDKYLRSKKVPADDSVANKLKVNDL